MRAPRLDPVRFLSGSTVDDRGQNVLASRDEGFLECHPAVVGRRAASSGAIRRGLPFRHRRPYSPCRSDPRADPCDRRRTQQNVNVWMLIEPEPGIRSFTRGEDFSGTVVWHSDNWIPQGVTTTGVEAVRTVVWGGLADNYYSVARIVGTRSEALLGHTDESHPDEPTTLSGCLEFDPYMSIVHPTVTPTATGKVYQFGAIVQEFGDSNNPLTFVGVDTEVCTPGSYAGIAEGRWVRHHAVQLRLAE